MVETIKKMQPKATSELAHAIVNQQVSHAYLFVGDNQEQVLQLGEWFAQALFCENLKDGYPCGVCNHCKRIKNNEFPDVMYVTTDKKNIGVDDIRDAKSEMGQTGIESDHRVFIIEHADRLTTAAANSLLKFLEDPVGNITTILLAPSATVVLPTIRSRVQIVNLADSADSDLAQQLKKNGYSDADLKMVHAAHLENLLLESNVSAESIEKIRSAVKRWFGLLMDNSDSAFVEVGAKLITILENREQQEIFMSLLENLFSDYLNTQIKNNSNLEIVTGNVDQFLQAKQMWSANVSFENSLENLALQINAH